VGQERILDAGMPTWHAAATRQNTPCPVSPSDRAVRDFTV